MKKFIAVLLALTMVLSIVFTSSVFASADTVVNVTDSQFANLVTNVGTANENWTPAIKAAIAYAVDNGIPTVYIPAGTYLVEGDTDSMAAWEIEPAAVYLPDAAITISGAGATTVLKKGAGETNISAMFRTTFGGSAALKISNLKILGKGNLGSGYGLIDGIVLNGSSNTTVENVTIDMTKRHGLYLIAGAHNNTVSCISVSNTNRECLGTGIQFEGAYDNTLSNVALSDIGGNAIDFNSWSAGSYYPAVAGSPYASDYHPASTGNVITGGTIDGTGVCNGGNQGAGTTQNAYNDDYYGINIINGSNNNTVTLNSVKNIRLKNVCDTAAAVRLMGVTGCAVTIDSFSNSSHAVVCVSDNNATGNTVTVESADQYKESLLACEGYDATKNNITVTHNTSNQVLKLTVHFKNGEEGTKKSVSILPFAENAASFYGYTFSVGDKIVYDYLLPDDAVAGMGTVDYENSVIYKTMSNIGAPSTMSGNLDYSDSADMTTVTGYKAGEWNSVEITPYAGVSTDGVETSGIAKFLLTLNTTAAVSTTKNYAIYYRNIRIVNASGTTVRVLYDGSQSLQYGKYEGFTNTEVSLEEAFDPTSFDKVIETTFTATSNGLIYATPSLYSLGLKHIPESMAKKDENGSVIIYKGYQVAFDYAVSEVAGTLGQVQLQECTNWWTPLSTSVADKANTWISNTSVFGNGQFSGSEAKALFNFSLNFSVNDAVEGKQYKVYYKNLRILDTDGNIVYNLFDPDYIGTSRLAPECWGADSGCTWTMAVVNDPYPSKTGKTFSNALKATISFTDGTADTAKSAAVSLYGWNGGPLGGVTFAEGDSIQYEYLIPDLQSAISGIGMIDYKKNVSGWEYLTQYDNSDSFGNKYCGETNLVDIPGFSPDYWIPETVYPHEWAGYKAGGGIGHFCLEVNTTEAVDTTKEYTVYYRNIKWVDASGNVKCVIYDGTQNLNLEGLPASNASMTVNPVSYSNDRHNIKTVINDDVLDFSVVYSESAANTTKTADYSIFGNSSTANDFTLSPGDKIAYDLMLSDPVGGLGGIDYQNNGSWWLYQGQIESTLLDEAGNAVKANSDLTVPATNKWYTRVYDSVPSWVNFDYGVAHWCFPINSTEYVVEAGKVYHAYYRNIRIIHSNNTVTQVYPFSWAVDAFPMDPPTNVTGSITKWTKSLANIIFGDFNGDNTITATDIITMCQIILGNYEKGGSANYDKYDGFADANDDNTVNILDLVRLKKAAANVA